MDEELKPLPCPFCGSTKLNTEDARDFISCLDCSTEGPFRMGQGSEASIAAWNRRHATEEAADQARDERWWIGPEGQRMSPEIYDAWAPHEPLRAALYRREPPIIPAANNQGSGDTAPGAAS